MRCDEEDSNVIILLRSAMRRIATLLYQMMEFFAENNLVTKQQHGFLKRHSTSTNLLECLADWTLALNNKLNMDIIYIDYSRAFDSVVHSKLIHKLKCYGIQYELLTWIESFLTNG